MMSILDQLAVKQPEPYFRPTTIRDLFVLRLAQKLGEALAFRHYVDLAERHADETLLLAYRRAANHGRPPRDLARRFHVELESARGRNGHGPPERLLAIKVERRSIAVAVFIGSRLDFHDVRNLSSQPDKAEASALGFVSWVISSFEIESVTLERMTNGNTIRRAVLNQAIIGMLRAGAVPVWEVSKRELFHGYCHPPPQTRSELREVAHTILWSMFNTDRPDGQEIDAASLGLHVQTERLFLY